MKQRDDRRCRCGATAVRANPLGQASLQTERRAGEAGGGGLAGTAATACLHTHLLPPLPCTSQLAAYMSFPPFPLQGAASQEPSLATALLLCMRRPPGGAAYRRAAGRNHGFDLVPMQAAMYRSPWCRPFISDVLIRS